MLFTDSRPHGLIGQMEDGQAMQLDRQNVNDLTALVAAKQNNQ